MKIFYTVDINNRTVAVTDNLKRAKDISSMYSKGLKRDEEIYICQYIDNEKMGERPFTVESYTSGNFYVEEKDFYIGHINEIFKGCKNIWGNQLLNYEVNVFAKDENHAIKIAQDLWAEYKAKKEGIV